jgi:hypothetical protein
MRTVSNGGKLILVEDSDMHENRKEKHAFGTASIVPAALLSGF